MIGDQTVTGYLIQFLILSQPLVWVYLYESKYNVKEDFIYGFYFIGAAFIWVAAMTGAEIGFYRTHLLVQYALLVMGSTYLYNQRKPPKEAVCLGFLTVFLNSFYWEAPLHFAEILSTGYHIGMLVQFWRLYPLTFFKRHYKTTKTGRIYLLSGLAFSGLVIGLRFYTPFFPHATSLYAVNRVVCMVLLTKTWIEAGPRV